MRPSRGTQVKVVKGDPSATPQRSERDRVETSKRLHYALEPFVEGLREFHANAF